MICGFHCCRHESFPDQYIGLQVKHLIILRSIQFSTKFHEDFLNVPKICDFQVMVVICSWILIFLLQFPGTPWTFRRVALGSALFAVSRTPFETCCCLISTLENFFYGCWTLFWTMSCLQFLAAPWTMSRSQFPAALLTDAQSSCGSTGILDTSGPKEEDGPLFRRVEIKHTDLSFANAGSSSFFLSWILFDVVVWTNMAAREHRKCHNVEQTEKVVPFITREAAFGQEVS